MKREGGVCILWRERRADAYLLERWKGNETIEGKLAGENTGESRGK